MDDSHYNTKNMNNAKNTKNTNNTNSTNSTNDAKLFEETDGVWVLRIAEHNDMLFEMVNKLFGLKYEYTENKGKIAAALDFEFESERSKGDADSNSNSIQHILALGQVRFTLEYDDWSYSSPVILYDPRSFTKKQRKKYIDVILLNRSILKILHGSESLDLPALREFIGDDAQFKEFVTNQIIDTRFLCAAYNILWSKNHPKEKTKTKCTIYSALYDLELLTKTEFDNLNSVKINYNKPWTIKKLTEKQVTYAMMDVFGLYNLYTGYAVLLGNELTSFITDVYASSILTRSGLGLISFADLHSNKYKNIVKNIDLATTKLFDKVVAKTPIGDFTLGDAIKIDYLRKNLLIEMQK